MKDIVDLLFEKYKKSQKIINEIYIFRKEVVVLTGSDFGASGVYSDDVLMNYSKKYKCYSEFKGKTVQYLFENMLDANSSVERSIKLATINSLIEEPKNLIECNSFDYLSYDYLKDKKISFIGHFPRAEKMRANGLDVNIIELIPREGDISWDNSHEILQKTDIIYITGHTILNNSFLEVINRTPNAQKRLMAGMSVPLHPVLMECGIDIIGTSLILEPVQMIRYWQYGGAGMKYAPPGALKTCIWDKSLI
ncbi:MAG: DUF364 domain-containing protein [Candidatus Muirbacterium halophilum]|nr:DUF364 domain-containing protein [Candidatus Muirbacterium halophilum]MCK9476654.1 DUF364 domain-containing protein [Candidatus Muirbacterium halophilum]